MSDLQFDSSNLPLSQPVSQMPPEMQDISVAMKKHLEHQLIPFWLSRAWDEQYGGFLTNFDGQGNYLDTPEKYLNTQCRLLWWFSALSRRYPNNSRFRQLADVGYDFITRHFWDEQMGGWYWKVARNGKCLDDGKIVYGQSFAIYAFAEYSLAIGSSASLRFANQTFDLLQKYAADTLNGGYFENMEADWQRSVGGFAGGDRKGLDTHMHLLEAFTNLYAASNEDIHRRKLLELVDLITGRMIDPDSGCGRNQFDVKFNAVPAIAIKRTWNAERNGNAPELPTDTTSFGHNVELAWLLHRALSIAQLDLTPYLPTLHKLVDHAVRFGLDVEYGGVYRDGTAHGQVLIDEKEWWQQAECLVGFLDAYSIFNDVRFWEAFVNTWQFVSTKMINPQVGEWFTLLDRAGMVLVPDLGNPWKVAYHTGRSLLECVALLTPHQ